MDKLISIIDNFISLDTLKKFNRIAAVLVVVIFVSIVVWLFFFSSSKKSVEDFFKAKPGSASALGLKVETAQEKPYTVYAEAIGNKALFISTAKQAVVNSSANPAVSLKNIALVGILDGDPIQAIVEDKQAQKTYYLSKGQEFNGMTVQDIGDNNVVLEYNGNIETLTL